MNERDEQTEKRGFKVEDRRRFSESGDAKPEAGAEAPKAAEAAPTETTRPAASTAPPPPEPSFSTFVLSLSTQAMALLGEIPHPLDNTTKVDLVGAKQLIDILGLLQAKTRGNLEQAENALLENALYDLRLRYVEQARAPR